MEPRSYLGIGLGGLAAILAAGVLEGLPGSIDQIHVVLVLVIVIVGAAALGGRLAGAVTAVIATVSFDFFHTQPVQSFAIDSTGDLITTALLLIVGLGVGELATWGQLRATRSRDEEHEIRRLRRVGALATTGASRDELIEAVSSELVGCLHLERAYYRAGPPCGLLPTIEPGGGLDRQRYELTPDGFALDPGGVSLPVHAGGTVIGSFTLVPRPSTGVSLEHRIIAAVMADQLGATLAGPMSRQS